MAARPAVAALSCFQCRTRAIRSIASLAIQLPAASASAFRQPLLLQSFSTSRSHRAVPLDDAQATPSPAENRGEESSHQEPSKDEPSDTPWYLQVEPPRHAPRRDEVPLPALPDSPPEILEPLMKYVYEQMGLDDLTLLDLRSLDPPSGFGPNLLMLFGTARSERHLHVSSSRFVHWLRRHHGVHADADGLILPGELKIKLRRMRRKAKLLGANAMVPRGGDDGITTGWICVDLGTLGESTGETASFDSGGQISGFGTQVNGTTIIVQVMTERRREELDLETLWRKALQKSDATARKIQEAAEARSLGNGEDSVDGIESLRPRNSRLRRKHVSTANQTRSYSTSRRLDTALEREETSELLDRIRNIVHDIQWSGKEATTEQFLALLQSIFGMHDVSHGNHHARGANSDAQRANINEQQAGLDAERADLAANIMQTMHERGQLSLSAEILIPIIEAIVRSGTSSPKLLQIQSNMELLLLKSNIPCPSDEQLIRLMDAYAYGELWDKYWLVWRMPPRFLRRRTRELYTYVFERAVATRHRQRCTEALRTCFHEMLAEEPSILPTGRLLQVLRECIRIVDPAAPGDVDAPLPEGAQSAREFVRMWQQLDVLADLGGGMLSHQEAVTVPPFEVDERKGLRMWKSPEDAAMEDEPIDWDVDPATETSVELGQEEKRTKARDPMA